MTQFHRRFAGTVCAVLGALWFVPVGALAQSTVNRGASVLIFPKVVTTAGRDTMIQLTNKSNSLADARCFYVNGALTNPLAPPGPLNPPECTELDFPISLTLQQETVWVVSQGRPSDPFDSFPGIDPFVPPVAAGFEGELICVAIDASGFPIDSNALIGTATVQDLASGDVSRYNAIGLAGLNVDGDTTLLFDGNEYEACPEALRFSHVADGGTDLVAGPGSSVSTEYTFAPCSWDFVSLTSPSMAIDFVATNELEITMSASTTVECWGTLTPSAVSAALGAGVLGDVSVQMDVRAGGASPGIVAVGESVHVSGGLQAAAAFNGSVSGARATADTMVLP